MNVTFLHHSHIYSDDYELLKKIRFQQIPELSRPYSVFKLFAGPC